MSSTSDKIRQGVLLEERFVEVISDDIQKLDDFKSLDDGKKRRIIKLLSVMRDDSARHEKLLKNIYAKY
ncbi:MAG TPA: hypothetical protein VJB62_04120 [Patescibacteria group bacterium]|nr:hypothetical protein [Patescibacteria group bacterium]